MLVIAIFTIMAIIYSARISVINSFASEQLKSLDIEINCLDISLTSNMSVLVDKLCFKSAKANIEILDMAVTWQYSSGINLTDIDISQVKIFGTAPLFVHNNHQPKNKQSKNKTVSQALSSALRALIQQIKQFQLPIKINVAEIFYVPFTAKTQAETPSRADQQTVTYTARLSALDNVFSFSLRDSEALEFITAKLSKSRNQQAFSIAFSSKMQQLQHFANVHQLPVTAELQNTLRAIDISGGINTLIEYQADSVNVKTKITDLLITSEDGIGDSGAFTLQGTLNFKSQLPLLPKDIISTNKTKKSNEKDAELALTFIEKNFLSLEYSQAQLITMLEKSKISPTVISLIKDNPLTLLNVELPNNTRFAFNNEQLNLSDIEIIASGDQRVHQVKLNTVSLALAPSHSKTKNSANQLGDTLNIDHFVLDSQVKLAELSKLTTAPVTLHLAGSLARVSKHTTLNLTENSAITASKIMLTKQNSRGGKNGKKVVSAKAGKTKRQALLSLNTLRTMLHGNIQLQPDNTLSLNLKTHSQAAQLHMPKTLQIHSFDLISEIKGYLDDIQIHATTSADGVNLGSIIISGPALAPKLQVAANALQLTDLLSLNIQLPTKIELIDGLLDYSVSGQLTDLNNIESTPFNVSVAVTSASGDIDGIWLQELNWQQHFTILAGKIATKPNSEENLTVELIETPTPISKLSINTNWTFNKSFAFSASKLKADVLGGSFSIPKIQWPFEHGHSVDVQLESIDLEQVLALDKKQGIVVTGDISGQLPVTFDGEKYTIDNGELHNISNGLIQVIDNPAVAELKASNTQLQLAFDALQNLHYHQLSSAVSMADDGYMLLETVIKGRNPDIDNDVNLNLNLSYDLLGLLESLSITQRFEENIIKGLQKN